MIVIPYTNFATVATCFCSFILNVLLTLRVIQMNESNSQKNTHVMLTREKVKSCYRDSFVTYILMMSVEICTCRTIVSRSIEFYIAFSYNI